MTDDKDRVSEGTTEQKAEKHFRDALGASLTEGDHSRRRALYWCLATVCIGCLMPFLQFVGLELLTAGQRRIFYSTAFPPLNRTSLAEFGRLWLWLTVFFDWPFLVYAFLAWKWIRKAGQERSASVLPVVIGLIGLSLPYVFIWGIAAPAELSSGAPDAGQGIGILGPIFGPVGGGIGAWIGWRVGLGILRNRGALD